MNQVLDQLNEPVDPFASAAARRIIEGSEWWTSLTAGLPKNSVANAPHIVAGHEGPCMMIEAARKVLDAFDSLPEPERYEVAREILRRTALANYGPLDDADLVALAADVFLELERDASRK